MRHGLTRHKEIIITLSLLFALPLAMLGQTFESDTVAVVEKKGFKSSPLWLDSIGSKPKSSIKYSRLPYVLGASVTSKYESPGWLQMLLGGGGIVRTHGDDGRRTGARYLAVELGVGSLLGMNFVDGFTLGPALTLGKVNADLSRWELDVEAKYAFSRERMMGAAALRYVMAPEYCGSVTAFVRQRTVDYDDEPLMPAGLRSLASTLFGWNGYKLYQSTAAGLKGEWALSRDWQVAGSVSFERRDEMRNCRKRNLFRIAGSDNVPVVRGHDVGEWTSDPLLHWREDRLVCIGLTLGYMPGRWVYVRDDLHYGAVTPGPVVRLRMAAGLDAEAPHAGSLRYVGLDLSVRQTIRTADTHSGWRYVAAVGFYPVRDKVGLADMHHFDAARFGWQIRDGLTWFSLLTDYELSTSRPWAEVHGEWSSHDMLLGRFATDWLGEYIRLHMAAVTGCRSHTEVSYGVSVLDDIQVGLSVGWDALHYDGVAFNLVWDIWAKK